jgi:16S rRNA (guanine(966)-N(2))-methyltransferase RsmD
VATRITGGILRGRVLRSPAVSGLRPTSERVRAALFAIIGSDAVEGCRVADLYAGTGALGLDALSRGAKHVDFVEQNARLCSAIREHLRQWSLTPRARVHRGKVLNRIESLTGEYDLVMADPPYGDSEIESLVARLQSARLVRPGGMVILEHRSNDTQDYAVGRFCLETTRKYGDTAITVLTAG